MLNCLVLAGSVWIQTPSDGMVNLSHYSMFIKEAGSNQLRTLGVMVTYTIEVPDVLKPFNTFGMFQYVKENCK